MHINCNTRDSAVHSEPESVQSEQGRVLRRALVQGPAQAHGVAQDLAAIDSRLGRPAAGGAHLQDRRPHAVPLPLRHLPQAHSKQNLVLSSTPSTGLAEMIMHDYAQSACGGRSEVYSSRMLMAFSPAHTRSMQTWILAISEQR